jgi:hypothetical protein
MLEDYVRLANTYKENLIMLLISADNRTKCFSGICHVILDEFRVVSLANENVNERLLRGFFHF